MAGLKSEQNNLIRLIHLIEPLHFFSQPTGWTSSSSFGRPQPSEPRLNGRRIFGSGLLGIGLLGPGLGGDGISQTRAQTSDPGSGRSGLGHSADLAGPDRGNLGPRGSLDNLHFTENCKIKLTIGFPFVK